MTSAGTTNSDRSPAVQEPRTQSDVLRKHALGSVNRNRRKMITDSLMGVSIASPDANLYVKFCIVICNLDRIKSQAPRSEPGSIPSAKSYTVIAFYLINHSFILLHFYSLLLFMIRRPPITHTVTLIAENVPDVLR